MALTAGIVGLPNVGKSTLFNAITKAGAEAANYPFATIDPNVGMVEVPDEPIPDNASENVENIIKDKEADKIVAKIKDDEYVIVLDLHGKEIDSVAFSKHIEECMIRGKSTITFVIGGSLGLGKSLLQRANYRLCFSKMTFPHQLMKLILVEQVYRAFKIMRRETYHK